MQVVRVKKLKNDTSDNNMHVTGKRVNFARHGTKKTCFLGGGFILLIFLFRLSTNKIRNNVILFYLMRVSVLYKLYIYARHRCLNAISIT